MSIKKINPPPPKKKKKKDLVHDIPSPPFSKKSQKQKKTGNDEERDFENDPRDVN